MRYRSYYQRFSIPRTSLSRAKSHGSQVWEVSPRDEYGNLIIRQNRFSKYDAKNVLYNVYGPPNVDLGGYCNSDPSPQIAWSSIPGGNRAMDVADTRAMAKFDGLLKSGGASMAVTLATYKQSADMIKTTAGKLATWNKSVARRLAGRRTRSIASSHLEFIFGWTPLYTDLWAAANTVIQQAEVQGYLRTRGQGYFEHSESYGTQVEQNFTGICTSTVSAKVRIANPNLWLANRAGLLNPALIAWDIIPYSFLVGMFANVSQLITSVTAHIGLEFEDVSVTRKSEIVGSSKTTSWWLPVGHPSWGGDHSVFTCEVKNRSLGELPTPSLIFKVPEASWETAAMALSLAVQKFPKINKILSI